MSFPDRSAGLKLIELIQLIAGGHYPSIQDICDRFECTRRTAERYIERIRDNVADDLIYDRKRKGYRFAAGGPNLPSFRLTEGEAIAVFLAARLLEQCRGTPYEGAVRGALSKLACLFPKEVSLDQVPSPAGWISFRSEPLRGEERHVMKVFDQLHRARASQETVRIKYFTASRGEWNERDVDPYHLRFHDGAWYVIAYCHWRREIKIFALDRIAGIERTGRSFEGVAEFDPEAFMADSFRIERGEPVDVAIRFAPEQARYVRGRQWHSTQTVEELPDGPGGRLGEGSLILRMRVGGLGEVKRWVLSFGAGAEVLEPEELRAGLVRESTALYGLYDNEAEGGIE